MTSLRTARYVPTIVWSTGTDTDTSAYDDVSRFYLNSAGLVVDGIGRDQIRAYSPPAAPAFDLTLNNWGGEFSPGGPIGSLVGRGPAAYLDLLYGDDQPCNAADLPANDTTVFANGQTSYRVFDGVLHTVDHLLTRPSRSVALRCLGHLATRLLEKKPRTTQLYENLRTDEAVGHLLDLVDWPPEKRVLDTGDTQLLYWWLDGSVTGIEALNRILAAEGAGGCAYEQGGIFYFEGRQSRQNNPRSAQAQWLFTDASAPDANANDSLTLANSTTTLANGLPGGAVLLKDVNPSTFSSNPDEVIASATAVVNQRSPTGVQKVWELGRPLVLGANEVLITEGPTQDPFKLATALTAVDYTAVPAGAVSSVEVVETSGQRARIRWTAGPAGATVNGGSGGSNGPQLRAVSLPVISEIVVTSTVSTAQFALRYAAREHQMGMWPEVARLVALDIVNSMVLRYRQERRQATIKIANLDAAHMSAIMRLRISDRVTWMQQHGGINDPYWIEQIGHEIAPGGGLHIVTLGLERVFDLVAGRFDDATFDTPPKNLFGA